MERGMTAQHSQEKDGSPEMSARVELSHCAVTAGLTSFAV